MDISLNKDIDPLPKSSIGSKMKQSIITALTIVATLGLISTATSPPPNPAHTQAADEPSETQVVELPTETLETPTVASKSSVDPLGCEPEQYWAEEAPYSCIDKKISTPTATYSGNWVAQCHAWAAEAGITLPSAAITLIGRESKCSPTICNPNGIACGIPQALPFSKTGCSLSVSGATCQIKWMYNYVISRYGSWESALAHSYSQNWY